MEGHWTGTQLDIVLTAFGVLFASLGFFIRSKLNSYDGKHKDHYNHHLEILTKLDRRSEAFNNVMTVMDKDLRLLIKSDEEILATVNGKYISRREFDAASSSREEWRALLIDRLDKMDALSERLRAFKDHDYGANRQSDIAHISLIEIEIAKMGVILSGLHKNKA